MVFIITYYNGPQYLSTFTDNTFQFIYATDYRSSYGIFNYQKLKSTREVARFIDGTCNQRELPFSGSSFSNQLVSSSNGPLLGRYVYKLSNEVCRIFEDSGIIFTNVSLYRSTRPILSSISSSWQHRRPVNFIMLIEQRINYESNFGVSFINGGLNTYASRSTYYTIWSAIFKR